MIRVAIFGGSGYTGQELVRILTSHPKVKITAITSRRYNKQSVTSIYPSLTGLTTLKFSDLSVTATAKEADVIFLALPHGVSMSVVSELVSSKKKIIDLSADFRIADVNTYEKWYQKHTQPILIEKFVYGLPELFRKEIAKSDFVANPGCYPTSIILALAPALKEKLIRTNTIIANSCSGVSGAGRDPQMGSLFCEVSQSFKAYKVGGTHRHIPEIEQGLSRVYGCPITVTFTPHLLPINRGILSTTYTELDKNIDSDKLHDIYKKYYASEEFVRVYPFGMLPSISAVAGSNFCDIGIAVDSRTNRLIIVSAIDNLIKGASGQAVQNMNVICNLPENTGLQAAPLFP